jgi:prevent-host-death family protein
MGVAFVDQNANLDNIIRRAEAGEEIVIVRDGKPVARIEALRSRPDATQRRAVLDAFRGSAKPFWNDDDSAARSQDFLYDEFGLPK